MNEIKNIGLLQSLVEKMLTDLSIETVKRVNDYIDSSVHPSQQQQVRSHMKTIYKGMRGDFESQAVAAKVRTENKKRAASAS